MSDSTDPIDDDDALVVRTRVGRAEWGDNQYCGASVGDLAGREGMWSLVSLAVGGPRLGPEELGVLDDLAVSLACPDPRIWPLKMTRLASAYGNAVVGQCVGYLGIARSQVGGHAIGIAARALVELSHRLPEGWTRQHLASTLAAVMREGGAVAGFGVPFRPRDERVDVLRECMRRRRRTEGRHWTLVHAIEEELALVATRPLPMNIGGAAGAALLDLGFTPDQVLLLGPVLLLPNYLANAAEGARQRSAVLRRLPQEHIEYVGRPPRTSPRAGGR